MSSPPVPPLTRPVHLFTLLVASIGNAVVWGMNSFLQFHAGLQREEGGFGLSPLDVGIVFGIASVFGAASNVFWGVISDKTSSRLGKRKPFMLVFPPLVLITLWMAASVDVLFGISTVFWTFLLMMVVKGILHAGANVPYSTVIPEVVPPERRVVVSELSAAVQGIGFGAGAIVPALLFESFPDFGMPFIVAGAIMVALYLVSATAVPSDAKPARVDSVFASMKVAFKNRNFMAFEAAQFLWTLGLNIVIFAIPFLAQDVVGIVTESAYGWFFVSFLLIAGAFLLGMNFLVQKRHAEKKKTLLVTLLISTTALPFVGFVGSPAFSPIPLMAQVYVFGSFLFGGLVGVFIFPYAIMMALIDYSTGSEGAYNGTNGTVLGLAAIPAGPVGGILVGIGFPYVGIVGALLFLASAAVLSRVHVPEHLFEKVKGEGTLV